MTLLRAGVLGGVDGVITSFAIVAGAHALEDARRVVLIVGSSSVLADGLSMGVSEFLSSSAERALAVTGPSPLRLGVVCFASFVAFGIVPLAAYLIGQSSLLACAMFSSVELMILGAVRSMMADECILRGFTQTLVLGAIAGGAAFGVGQIQY